MTSAEYISNINQEVLAEVATEIARKFGLTFVSNQDSLTGSVCFANQNQELRDDFKQVFTTMDVLDYMHAVIDSPKYSQSLEEWQTIDFLKIPFPENSIAFWQMVQRGFQIRQKVK